MPLSIDAAVPILEGAGFTTFRTAGKKKATNGEADGLAISKDLTLEIINSQLPFSLFAHKNPALTRIPRIDTPNGGFHLYYRCEVTGALEWLACDETGLPLITTVSYAVTYPTPGYRLEGRLTQTPTISVEERESLRALFRMFDRRPPIAEIVSDVEADLPVPRRVPAQPDPRREVAPLSAEPLSDLAGAYAMMTLTERNVAKALENEHGQRFRYCKAWGTWLEWSKSSWAPEQTDFVYDSIVQIIHARNMEMKPGPAKASFASGAERIARASRAFATKTAEWDRDSWLLNQPDGTLDLRNMDAHAHVRTDYITKCTRVSPMAGPHPVFDMFMRDICLADEGLIQFHQRSLGACLSGAIQDNFLLFWYGTGQNGKNTFGDLVTWILGDYAKVIPIETLISNKNASHPTTLANLRGLRLAVCSEVSEGAYWDEARVKSLTGDTDISARFMRQDFFEFKRTHKHLVYGNHRPMLRIVDLGMQARLHIVPFKAHFPPDARDPEMRSKLEAEAPQILSWLIAGHEQWLEDGYLKKCSAVQAETDAYFEAQSTNEAWLSECCIEGHDRQGTAKELYGSFKSWKEARGEGVISQTRWGEWFGQRFSKSFYQGRVLYRGVELKPQSVLDFQA